MLALSTALLLQTSIAVLAVAVVTELACAEVLKGWEIDNHRHSTSRAAGSAQGGGIDPMAIGAAKEREGEHESFALVTKLCPTPNAGSQS